LYNPIITHDIDRYFKWHSLKSLFGEYTRILFGNSTWTFKECRESYKTRKKNDPFSNLKVIADFDRKAGIQSIFYIMTTHEKHKKNINDYKLSDISKELEYVLDKGCEVGIHPGFLTSDSYSKMEEQILALESTIGKKIKRSRQHYLNYNDPLTFINLAKLGIENDSSIYPTSKYDTYDMAIESDERKVKITQTPLVFMDTHHMHKSDNEILNILEESLKPAKENSGEVMILWHNNNISNNRERGLYKEALEVIKEI